MAKITRNEVNRNREIGERLRTLRLRMGLSQSDVAGLLGVSFQQLRKYEVGMNAMTVTTLEKLADGLRVPVQYFYGAVTQSQQPPRQTKDQSVLSIALQIQSIRNKPARNYLCKLIDHIAREPGGDET